MYLGIPVLLNEKGYVYKYLCDLGLFCYTIQSDLQKVLNGIPNDFDVKSMCNKKIIEDVYSNIAVQKRIKL